MDYIRRVIDEELNRRQEAFNAINIIGPKGCGNDDKKTLVHQEWRGYTSPLF